MPQAEALLVKKKAAAVASLAFNTASVVIKIVAALVTGSVSLLSEAVHSATDVLSSGLVWLGIRAAAVPPDEEHPFGHGKIESLSGFAEAIMLVGIVGYVGFESVRRLIAGPTVQQIDFGIAVMAASALGSFLVARYVRGIGKEASSIALLSNSQHLMVDCVTSLGVLVALAITKLTGWAYADPLFALCFACFLGYGATKMVRAAFHELIDIRLPEDQLALIRSALDEEPEMLGYHRLRTRRSGGTSHVDLHIVVPNEWSVVQAHELADKLEHKIEALLSPAQVVIHVDPFDAHKAHQGELSGS